MIQESANCDYAQSHKVSGVNLPLNLLPLALGTCDKEGELYEHPRHCHGHLSECAG